jgi:acetolactate synthase-1/2/3 large subunit
MKWSLVLSNAVASARVAGVSARVATGATGESDVASVLVECLVRTRSRYIFGIPGKSIHPLLSALARRESAEPGSVRFIMARHEGASAFMADGYARVSGGIGICLVTSGPGATNAVTGALCAQGDHSALLVLSGECPTTDFGRAAFQCGADPCSDVTALYRAVTSRSRRLQRPEDIVTEFLACIQCALGTPRSAVHLSVPVDLAAKPVALELGDQLERALGADRPTAVPPERLDAALEALLGARRPLILLGSGAAGALSTPRLLADLERQLVERHAVPVMTTPRAKGIFPESHALSLGAYGLAASEWSLRYLQAERLWPGAPPFDALLVVGSGLKQWATLGYHPQLVPRGPAFQIDHQPAALGRAFPQFTGLEGDATLALRALSRAAGLRDTSPHVAERRRFLSDVVKAVARTVAPEASESQCVPLFPERVLSELQTVLERAEVAERGVNLFLDIGNTTGWCWHYLGIDPPHRTFSNTAMGSMGWGLSAAIGGKLADPSRHALAVMGDGALLMNGSELSTAARYGVGVTAIVFDDGGMNMVTHGMQATHAEPEGLHWHDCYALGSPDLVKFAESLGADARAIVAPGELVESLPGAFDRAERQQKPQVLVVRIDPSRRPPFPHLRPDPRA